MDTDYIKSIKENTKALKRLSSYTSTFLRGVVQGLGFVIGSTIVAGVGYWVLIHFVNPRLLHDISIDSMVEKTLAK